MTYLDFISRIRSELSCYVEALRSVYEGKCTPEEVDPVLKRSAQDVGRSLKAFEANREKDSQFIYLCPRCNELVPIENGDDIAAHPERVGQGMVFEKDIWQSYQGYRCPLCGYKKFSKIEHWE